MAITNAALASAFGGAPGQPTFVDVVTLDLDASYPEATGGYADFYATTLAPIIGPGKTVLHVLQNNFPGTNKGFAKYDRANDKLQIFDEALAEWANATNMADVTGLELVVISK